MEGLAWFVGMFGVACLVLGVAAGYQWGHGNGYKKGLQVGDGACEARHLGKLGKP